MSALFHEILYRPLFNLLVFLYNFLPGHDLGFAIIVLTIMIRVLFIPLSLKAQRSSRDMARIQPKIQELQAKFKDDKQALAQATMSLYKEHKVNPLSGCLPILIQLPVIWALYRVFMNGVNGDTLSNLYAFVHNPGTIGDVAFGFLNLSKNFPALAIFTGVLQGIQSWFTVKLQKTAQSGSGGAMANNPALKMTQQMMYFFPIMITVISWGLPAGLVLYWMTTTAFSILEQLYIRRKYV